MWARGALAIHHQCLLASIQRSPEIANRPGPNTNNSSKQNGQLSGPKNAAADLIYAIELPLKAINQLTLQS
jgi:hypothetical protein